MADRVLSVDDKQRLCQVLLNIRALRDDHTRNLYVTELETAIGQPLNVTRHPDARHDLFSVITSCQSYPGALRRFVGIIRGFHGDSSAVSDAERILDELDPAPILTASHKRELVLMLRSLEPNKIARAYSEIAGPVTRAGPDTTDLPGMVNSLEIAPNGERPPVLILADRLAHEVEPADSKRLHEWIDRVGGAIGLDQEAIRRLCIETKQSQADERPLDPQMRPVPPRSTVTNGINRTSTDGSPTTGDPVSPTTAVRDDVNAATE